MNKNSTELSSYAYDPFGRRTSVTENGQSTNYLWDGNSLLATYVSGSMENLYAVGSGIDEVLGVYGEQSQYLHSNHLGSITGITGTDGSVLGMRSYTPYGMMRNTTGSFNSNLGFIGREHDDTGLTYIRARYYDASVGRFTRVDPIRDGLNWYGYCGGNPVNYIDFTGLNIAIVVNPEGAGGNGHTSLYFQDSSGNWYKYDQGATKIPFLGNIGFISGSNADAGVSITPVSEPPKCAEQIETTSNQDSLITKSAKASQKRHNSGEAKYNIYTNNCTDAVVDVINNSGAGIEIPNPPLPVKPNSWNDIYQDWLFKNIK
ncbi:RHS repeat-associated core domain-containing protein [Orenia marismortui]|uniref:RHS repeat-associated core domain-containing protein n=1 Tax=Orenia marismortui TaxID=46469 RepID=UPI00036D9920|nr:RHS repeat-associated core domain-containing protein [Orenia marismortui]